METDTRHKVIASTWMSEGVHTLQLSPMGRFDLSLGYQLWQVCGLEEGAFHRYIFDFERLGELRDSGLAWLLMFSGRAARAGRAVSLANCSHAIAERCLASGFVSDEGTGLLLLDAEEISRTQGHRG